MRTSARTFLIGLIGLGVIAVVRTLVVIGVGDPETISLLSETLIVLACSFIVFRCSYLMPDERFKRVWRLIGWGTLFFALGDITLIVMALRGVPVSYPGPADVSYALYYVFMGLAVLLPSYEMRRNKEAQSAALVAGLTGAVAALLLYFGLIEPVLAQAGLSTAGLLLNSAFLFADVCLLAMPAVFVLMLISQSGDRKQQLPWFYVSVGLIAMAVADSAFAWMTAQGTYAAGGIVDYGWMLATLSLAVGASLALDAANTFGAVSLREPGADARVPAPSAFDSDKM